MLSQLRPIDYIFSVLLVLILFLLVLNQANVSNQVSNGSNGVLSSNTKTREISASPLRPDFVPTNGIVTAISSRSISISLAPDGVRNETFQLDEKTILLRLGERKSDEEMSADIIRYQEESAQFLSSSSEDQLTSIPLVAPSLYREIPISFSDIRVGESVSILHRNGLAGRVVVVPTTVESNSF